MRILHVIPQFPYFGGRTVIGGHASALLSLALAQAAGGAEVTILSYVEGQAGTIEVAPGLRAHSLFARARPGSLRFGLALRHRAGRWVAARASSFDVIHGHSGFCDYFVVSSRVKRAGRRPTLHSLYCPIPARGGRVRAPVVHGVLRRSAARLDALTAMSENVARSMRAYGLADPEVIGPAVDLDRFHPEGDVGAVRRDLGLADDEVAVLFVGNALPQKNMIGVLRAFHRLRRDHPRARLVVTTELKQTASDERLAILRRAMADLELESCTIQRGIVDDMPALMRACDVLVAPFLDSFGPSDYFMAVLEAMATGRPVVVSRVGGMPEVVEDDFGRLVDPHDDEAIASALAIFAADPERRRAAGAAARTYTERHFEPGAVAARYHDLYARIAR